MGLGVLKVDLRALEQALFFPKGYHIRTIQHQSFSRAISMLVEADAIPVAEEGHELPELDAVVRMELPEGATTSEFKKLTGEIRVGGGGG